MLPTLFLLNVAYTLTILGWVLIILWAAIRIYVYFQEITFAKGLALGMILAVLGISGAVSLLQYYHLMKIPVSIAAVVQ